MLAPLSIPPEIERLARANAWFAFSVSGGKDGGIAAVVANRFLDSVGHDRSKRVLIHADLGVIEWSDSVRICKRVAALLDLPLLVVRNRSHDMIGRWRNRYELSCGRYARMEIVTLIGPWSSAENRFCTSELKTSVIAARLVSLAGCEDSIVSVVGIRSEESIKRRSQSVFQPDPGLVRTSRNLHGFVWRPIKEWKLTDVFTAHRELDVPLHEAYTRYHSSRVSCSFCVLAAERDLQAAAAAPDNLNAFLRVVGLETESGFSFQSTRWLGDVRPDLLPNDLRDSLGIAKARRAARIKAEAKIPRCMLYEKGWPTFVPSFEQCALLADVRGEVCALHQIASTYLSPASIRDRYQELFEMALEKQAAKARGGSRRFTVPAVPELEGSWVSEALLLPGMT